MFECSRRCWNYFDKKTDLLIFLISRVIPAFCGFIFRMLHSYRVLVFFFQNVEEFHKLIWRFTSLFTMSCLFGVCKTFMLAPIGFEKNCNMLWGVDEFSRYISKIPLMSDWFSGIPQTLPNLFAFVPLPTFVLNALILNSSGSGIA